FRLFLFLFHFVEIVVLVEGFFLVLVSKVIGVFELFILFELVIFEEVVVLVVVVVAVVVELVVWNGRELVVAGHTLLFHHGILRRFVVRQRRTACVPETVMPCNALLDAVRRLSLRALLEKAPAVYGALPT